MGSTDEKAREEENKKMEAPKVAPFDLNDFTIIKEGEAEILMHAKNEVFFNKTQVLFFNFYFIFWFVKS